MEIEVGRVGIIKSGDDAGWQVKVLDDSSDSGGFLILISKEFNNPKSEGYDSWVNSYDEVISYFIESNWVIDWDVESK